MDDNCINTQVRHFVHQAMHVSKIRVNKKNYQDFIKRMFLYKSVEVQSSGRPCGMAFYNCSLKKGSCSWNWETLKIIRHQHLRQVRVYVFPCSISLMQWEVKLPAKISKEDNQKKIKNSWKQYVMSMCFIFWPMKNIFRKWEFNYGLFTKFQIIIIARDF